MKSNVPFVVYEKETAQFFIGLYVSEERKTYFVAKKSANGVESARGYVNYPARELLSLSMDVAPLIIVEKIKTRNTNHLLKSWSAALNEEFGNLVIMLDTEIGFYTGRLKELNPAIDEKPLYRSIVINSGVEYARPTRSMMKNFASNYCLVLNKNSQYTQKDCYDDLRTRDLYNILSLS